MTRVFHFAVACLFALACDRLESVDSIRSAAEPECAQNENDAVRMRLAPTCAPCHGVGASRPFFASLVAFEDLLAYDARYVVRGDPALETAVARFEPELALYVDGSDPFAIGARLADQARSALAPGGWLLVELGVGSDDRAREALTALDYTDIDVLPDLAGIGRVVVGRTRGA